MKLDFSSRFYTIGTKVADLIMLNILFFICCLPVVTIGASITAMYYVTLKMVENKDSYLFRSFFKSFRQNFRQATLIWLAVLLLSIFLFMDFRIALSMEGTFFKVVLYLLGLAALLFAFVCLYVFPVLSKFYNTISTTIRNAFLMSLRHLPYTLLMLLITGCPFLLFLLNPNLVLRLLPLFFIIAFSVPAYCNSYFFRKIFTNYIPEEEEKAEDTLPEA